MIAQGVAIPLFLTNAILVRIPLQLEKLSKVCKSRRLSPFKRWYPLPPYQPKNWQKKRRKLESSRLASFYPLATRKEIALLDYLEIIAHNLSMSINDLGRSLAAHITFLSSFELPRSWYIIN
jgi:hypothetical protein